MENASKALLMAAGVLIAILIISVMIVLFQHMGNVSSSYDKRISEEDITAFNSNFTKYLNKKLTIHEVVTICNFAKENGVAIAGGKTVENLKDGGNYSLTIQNDPTTGKVNRISITSN